MYRFHNDVENAEDAVEGAANESMFAVMEMNEDDENHNEPQIMINERNVN